MVSIRLKQLVDEVFQDYMKPSMLLATCQCDWKCCYESNIDISVCQNSELAQQPDIDVTFKTIVERYINNPLTQAIVIAGLEPMLQFNEVNGFVKYFRQYCKDDIVIYTGYYPIELNHELKTLQEYKNIIIKFGRFIPNRPSKYDCVLGVSLSSDNQYAQIIS